jgi:hypothetical protein
MSVNLDSEPWYRCKHTQAALSSEPGFISKIARSLPVLKAASLVFLITEPLE